MFLYSQTILVTELEMKLDAQKEFFSDKGIKCTQSYLGLFLFALLTMQMEKVL